jgi:protein TonB
MFEGSLVESRGLVVSETQRWTALGSLTVQCAVAGLLIAIPLLKPESLPFVSHAPELAMPLPVKPAVVPVRVEAAVLSTALSLAARPEVAETGSLMFRRSGAADAGAPTPTMLTGLGMGPGTATSLGEACEGVGSGVTVERARPLGPVKVSRGVSAGMLLAPIQPVYPAIAKAAGVEGEVVLEALISKAGTIESLRAVSGPPLLLSAALSAVQAARYKPYELNGQPTEVETTIRVIFQLRS